MADPTRPLTLSDLWLPGDVLGGAMLGGWTGPALVKSIITDNDGNDVWEGGICAGGHASNGFRGRDECRLDFTRPEVRDRAVRVLAAGDPVDDFGGRHCRCGTVHKESACPSCGLSFIQSADLLPIHAAELRGDITPGEAAGLVWCSVLRREAGLGVVHMLNAWADGDPRPGWFNRKSLTNRGGFISHDICWVSLGPDESSGRQTGEAGRAAADAAALAAGYSLREPDGILLLPLPDGVVGRLETSNG